MSSEVLYRKKILSLNKLLNFIGPPDRNCVPETQMWSYQLLCQCCVPHCTYLPISIRKLTHAHTHTHTQSAIDEAVNAAVESVKLQTKHELQVSWENSCRQTMKYFII